MKRVGILYHPMIEAAHTLAKELQTFLGSRGISVWLYSAFDWGVAGAQAKDADLVISIGGDGTILRAAQAIAPASTPITGINLGKLGFMTELSAGEAQDKLPALLAGEGWIDERTMLEARLLSTDGETSQVFYALNDIVVARGAISRMVHIEASIDGQPLTTYKADGVVMATATGSTGYSLAAGGPILHPGAREFILLPISAHLSSAYALVLTPAAVVKLRISTAHQATLSVDGHINLPLLSGATVTVKRSSGVTRFLRIHPEVSFYSSLERRLEGKQQVENGRESQN